MTTATANKLSSILLGQIKVAGTTPSNKMETNFSIGHNLLWSADMFLCCSATLTNWILHFDVRDNLLGLFLVMSWLKFWPFWIWAVHFGNKVGSPKDEKSGLCYDYVIVKFYFNVDKRFIAYLVVSGYSLTSTTVPLGQDFFKL